MTPERLTEIDANLARDRAMVPTPDARDLRAELDRLHTWGGLMSLLDEHWPEGLVPTGPDDDSRDPGPRIVSLLRWVARLRSGITTAPCDMPQQEPFDFGWCQTHDTTFALGEKCRFDGREVWEVYADEAHELRVRAVRAELEADRLRDQFVAETADGESKC